MPTAFPPPKFIPLAALLLALLTAPALAQDQAAAIEHFEREVRPLLARACWNCHGPEKQESNLRLDSREAIFAGGDRGPAIVEGKASESLILAALRGMDDLERMPPTAELEQREIEAIAKWIDAGAPWPETGGIGGEHWNEAQRNHWAFQRIQRPEIPQVQNTQWPVTPVDHFVLARLEASGLEPSPMADRRVLLRRAYFDLTGLPPSTGDIDAFNADMSANAWETRIHDLLASPRYGEQWGRHWLDVARYSDAKGYVYAREERFFVHSWAYRDWVINALNRDLPYNTFLEMQIAGDQLVSDGAPDLAAMGFLTIGRRFLGVSHDIIDDRIDLVTRATMGMTVACARCHDHKYDPIPTRDYYSLYGVFQSTAERLVRVSSGNSSSEEHQAFEEELKNREQKLLETMSQKRAETAQRVRARTKDYLIAQLELSKYPDEAFGQILTVNDVIPAFVRRWQEFLYQRSKSFDPVFGIWHSLAQVPESTFVEQAPKTLTEITANADQRVNPLVAVAFASPPQSMHEVAQRYGDLFTSVESQWQSAIQAAQQASQPAPTSLADPAAEELRQILFGPDSPAEVPDESISNTEVFFDLESCEQLWKLQSEVDRWLIQSPQSPPHALILKDRIPKMNPRVLKRGNPANKGDEVPRQFLEVVAGENREPFQQGSGRLELAKAITDPTNPLTARVIVNRVWQHHFGEGLVRSTSDFGMRAAPPSHPELLDWLADWFMQNGWSLKKLHHLIMTSAVYQQAQPQSADMQWRCEQIDPENRLLWHMPPHRLTLEEMRDALFAAGSDLDFKVGGKAQELWKAPYPKCRTVYGLIDREYLPPIFRAFDFANPDLHIPQRHETTVPQQALFFWNHPLIAERTQAVLNRSDVAEQDSAADKIAHIYQALYQRSPSDDEIAAGIEFIQSAEQMTAPAPVIEPSPWQYGVGEVAESEKLLKGFQELPYFSGEAWQGGPDFPNATFGWARLTAAGGHPGNNRQHAIVRRWTAPGGGRVQIQGTLQHQVDAGDGIRAFIITSRQAVVKAVEAHNQSIELSVDSLEIETGDTVDFVVDIRDVLNSDQFLWSPIVTLTSSDGSTSKTWDAQHDFRGPDDQQQQLTPWQQYVQVLFSANEFVFVD